MFIMAIVKYDSNEEMNLEMIMAGGDEGMFDRIYNNDNYKTAVKLWLPFMNERGFLDKMILDVEPKLETKTEE